MANRAVVIGASAGALQALTDILPRLTMPYGLPIFVVVHMPSDRKSILAEILQAKCALRIKEAEDKEPIEAGTVYIAAPDYHLLVEEDGCLSLSTEEPVLFSRPSIDVLFETAAEAYGEELIGIILTGSNEDGAAGLGYVAAEGGTAIVQSPEHAQFAFMPQAALKAVPAAQVLTLEQISTFLREAGSP
jgi:two-component system chemotaxis response regulator CheB